MITILTPTYNRAHTLPKLFESLKEQTSFDFEWLIIDDGSTDETEALVKTFKSESFPIRYYRKPNGGKHTALNYSHQFIESELVMIVDSDDYLTPDAVATIELDWPKFRDNPKIAVLSYLRQNDKGEHYSIKCDEMFVVDNDIHYRVNTKVDGDRAEVIRAEVFKEYKFPEYEAERFIGEGWMWTLMALKYDTVYISKEIYNCEYLAGGLTKSGRLFRMKNPLGMMENNKVYLEPPVCFRRRVKGYLLYGLYMFCADRKIKDSIVNTGHPWKMLLMIPFSYAAYQIWKHKYNFKKN